MYHEKIGVVGGFGAYATLGFYQRILEEFASDSERNYPQLFLDNDFTMPSRTRALLYGENHEEVVRGIAASLRRLCDFGADYIILVCGTAHAFLPEVYQIVPESEKRVLNFIDITRRHLKNCEDGVRRVLTIAGEGTLEHKVYLENFKQDGICCVQPKDTEYHEIRFFIESVKQNKIDRTVYLQFLQFLERFRENEIVLGCTEFAVLVRNLLKFVEKEHIEMPRYRFWDPLELVLLELKERCTLVRE